MPPKQGVAANQGKGSGQGKAPGKDAKPKQGGGGGGGGGAPGNKKAPPTATAQAPLAADKKQKKAEKAQAEAERRAAAERMLDISDEEEEEEEEEEEGQEQQQRTRVASDEQDVTSKMKAVNVREPAGQGKALAGKDGRGSQGEKDSKHAASSKAAKAEREVREAREAREARKATRELPQAASEDVTPTLASFSVTVAGSLSAMKAAMEGEKRAVKDIILEDFSISLPGRVLYANATLKLSHGHRYGFLGPNGQGKSTLLRFLAQKELPVPADMRVVLVEQEGESDERSAIQFLLSCDEEREALLQEEEELLKRMEGDEDADSGGGLEGLEGALKRLEEVEKKLEAIGAAGAEARARKILCGLGFSPAMMDQSLTQLSGGWRKRAALARGLYLQPDMLLLDEPTNHLDLEAVLWLSSYLQTWASTLLVVSHDQAFLEEVATDILVLGKQRLRLYRGGYDQYERGSAQEEAEEEKRWKKQDDTIKREMRVLAFDWWSGIQEDSRMKSSVDLVVARPRRTR